MTRHASTKAASTAGTKLQAATLAPNVPVGQAAYEFHPHFHPFVGELIDKLNRESLKGMLDPVFLSQRKLPFDEYQPGNSTVSINSNQAVALELGIAGPYSSYNWELLFHLPIATAVHLSNNQRFAEAQRMFHYVFDPTSTDDTPAPQRFWKFLAFRSALPDGDGSLPPYNDIQSIRTLLTLLSTPESDLTATQKAEVAALAQGYTAMLESPFQPHAIAQLRPGAYQWYTVMKYLDNLIAWGDSLFLQDTVESINEAMLSYILAANILGPRPEALPPHGVVKPLNYRQLKLAGEDPLGNALVELEGQFPFRIGSSGSAAGGTQGEALFGIGRTLYFCIPPNPKLIGYWDTVADRLFKIRNSENFQGTVRQLPLYDPPLDPGVLVKAAAAGLDIASIVSGANQPIGPVRAPLLVQKALEVASEVRSLGSALLASIEKGEGEQLALLRQGHETALHKLSQDMRYLQWRSAQESTKSLLTTRASALERLRYYARLLGLPADPNAPGDLPLSLSTDVEIPPKLTEAGFDAAYDALVGQYDKPLNHQDLPALQIAADSSSDGLATLFSGGGVSGRLFLNSAEDAELNSHLPRARDAGLLASTLSALAAGFAPLPDADADFHFWGLGGKVKLSIGTALTTAAKLAGDVSGIVASWEREQAGMASKAATYLRRADDWMLQYNLAAHELMQIGRQILTSLIAEQLAYHEYRSVKKQIEQSENVESFLSEKFTNVDFYQWQTSQITGLYYQYYRFACDLARKAEATMKRELMRPELDATQFVQFNYWDVGHRGLLSGEALVLDIKRMEMAYHDSNRRELELTRHVSMRQLDPLALIALRQSGECTLTVPEWLYDLDAPGLYMRRIKQVALSVPCVVGPYTSINCKLALQRSRLRVSPLLKGGKYGRLDDEDDRFVDYLGGADLIVTSSANNDSGMFETNLRDERFLPFEGAGAESTWTLSLPKELRTFDYASIADVVLHVRYTARMAGDPLGATATAEFKKALKDLGGIQPLLFSLRFDFPTEWAAFIKGNGDFTATLQRRHFPYLVQNAKSLSISSPVTLVSPAPLSIDGAVSGDLNQGDRTAVLTLPRQPILQGVDDALLVLEYAATI